MNFIDAMESGDQSESVAGLAPTQMHLQTQATTWRKLLLSAVLRCGRRREP